MWANFNNGLIHFLGAALACAQLAYWSIRLFTPPPAAAPPPAHVAPMRDPDPVLVAREFGDIEHTVATPGNIQLAGVFSAGPDSAAVFVIGDQPARAVRLGQPVAPGSKLVGVNPLGATLESDGVRRELRVPAVPIAQPAIGGGAAFSRQGEVLTAPSARASGTLQPVRAGSVGAARVPAPQRQGDAAGMLRP